MCDLLYRPGAVLYVLMYFDSYRFRASMGNWLPFTHQYVHLGLLACGVWAIAAPESVDALVMVRCIPI